jgi:hypothetical protein
MAAEKQVGWGETLKHRRPDRSSDHVREEYAWHPH